MTLWQILRKLASWWRAQWGWLLAAALLVLVLGLLLWAGYFMGWTGFNDWAKLYTGYDSARTLWEWLELSLLPGVVALAAGVLIWVESRRWRRSQAAQSQDAALRAYLDRMGEYLVRENLRGLAPESQVRAAARGQTLAMLRRLDSPHKGVLLEFLYGAGLLEAGRGIEMRGADLSGAGLRMAYLQGAQLGVSNLNEVDLEAACLDQANLSGARLHRANLSRASISQADLSGATLSGADLSAAYLGGARLAGADLSRANLSGADLSGADLTGADLTGVQLKGARITREQLSKAASNRSAGRSGGARRR
jgi:uncharacterized protein YjbI with pentapeptide repeats